MNFFVYLLLFFLILLLVILAVISCIAKLFSNSPGLVRPNNNQLSKENHQNHALFRHLPHLIPQIAWRELGTYPTPIHRGSVCIESSRQRAQYYVKREDLSSTLYGGNKVRTLQHQLATLEARATTRDPAACHRIIALGSGGSNQCVASVVHSVSCRAAESNMSPVTVAWVSEDQPDLVIFPLISGSSVVLPPGGNSPAGVLGQISGALELAEQIQAKELDDIDSIYLPIGSSCTISGLILGVCLARRLGLQAFQSPSFEICGVMIHHGLAAAERWFGLSTAKWARFIPFTIRHTIFVTNRELVRLGGPDLLQDAFNMLDGIDHVNPGQKQVRIICETAIVGQYGSHSDLSLKASQQYDDTGQIWRQDTKNNNNKNKILKNHESESESELGSSEVLPLWLCGHFAAKAYAVMLRDLKTDQELDHPKEKVRLFWQTKSAIQPCLMKKKNKTSGKLATGQTEVTCEQALDYEENIQTCACIETSLKESSGRDEWKVFQDEAPEQVKEWAKQGKAYSKLRVGKVDPDERDDIKAKAGYRHLMTPI